MTKPTSERILTRAEIDAAIDSATKRIRGDAKRKREELGTTPVREDSHDNEETIVTKVVWLLQVFLMGKSDKTSFSCVDLFSFIRPHTASTFIDKKTGEKRERPEEYIREMNAAIGHILGALDLRHEFMVYNRAQKEAEIGEGGRE